jgi:hypothetical protein
MAIDVTCPGCKTRFQVSEKFAGKQGPCPKCKGIIKVPELKDQVVIHTPEAAGPKDSTGQLVLKPLTRRETRLSTVQIVAIAGGVVVVLLVALVLRVMYGRTPATFPLPVLAVGAVILAPLLSLAGYTFLRDSELEPYRGVELILRLIPCTIVYPGLWGLFWFAFNYLGYQNAPLELLHYGIAIPLAVLIGAFTAHLSLDLDPAPAAFHCAMFLGATVLLRVIMNLPAAWNVVEKTATR